MCPSGTISKLVDKGTQTEICNSTDPETLRLGEKLDLSYNNSLEMKTSTPVTEYWLPARSNISFLETSMEHPLDLSEETPINYTLDRDTALKIASVDGSITLEELLSADITYIEDTSDKSEDVLAPSTQEIQQTIQDPVNESNNIFLVKETQNLSTKKHKLASYEEQQSSTSKKHCSSKISNRDFTFDDELITELENLVNIRVFLDLFTLDMEQGNASTLPSCYTSLSAAEKKIVDKLTVRYFVNKLMRGGELIPGTIDDLKPTNKFSKVGNSTKRAMNETDYSEVLAITNRVCRDTLLDWTPDAAKEGLQMFLNNCGKYKKKSKSINHDK